jgi:hypothetical protein
MMTNNMKKKLLNLGFLILVFFILVFFGYRCPLRYLLGLSCPFCGLTRAFISLLSFNFKKAFYYHLLWPLALIGIIIFILYEFKIIKVKKIYIRVFLSLFITSFLIYYFYRLFNDSDIVYFNFNKSLIYKIIMSFKWGK